MDSLSQAVLGASIAAACAPRGQRRAALLAGAVLGTMPDLDVAIDYGDPVANFTQHRGFSHSLIVLAPFSVLLWLAAKRLLAPVRAAPGRWFAAIALTLMTHPILDAHTAYGTQLLWPLDVPPVMWSTLFIIDPLYTLPLLVGTIAVAFRPAGRVAGRLLQAGLVLSTLYVGWSWIAKYSVGTHVEQTLAATAQANSPVFTTPTPFNTLLWRVVVLTDDGYLEGFDSLLDGNDEVQFTAHRSETIELERAGDIAAVRRLRWFARDFVKASVDEDRLVLADLRMGQEPFYVFTHVVATRGNPHWQAVTPEQIPLAVTDRALDETWRRLRGVD